MSLFSPFYICIRGDARAIAWFAARFQPQPAPSRARRRSKTKKTAPKGGLRRSKHARVRGLGAVSSLEASLASRTTERMPRGKWLRNSSHLPRALPLPSNSNRDCIEAMPTARASASEVEKAAKMLVVSSKVASDGTLARQLRRKFL
jgi:hypothetical protein